MRAGREEEAETGRSGSGSGSGAVGYRSGSSIVEGANTMVVEAHPKGSGTTWAPSHIDAMFARRTNACAARCDDAWPRISARLRLDTQMRRR